jgi:outer membrane beta-barrel protein
MRPSPLFAIFALLAVAPAVAAQEVARATEGAPTRVQGKLYSMSQRWEVGLSFATALNTPLVSQYGGLLSVTYHPNEWADVGVDLLANQTRLSGLSDQIRGNLPGRMNNATGQPNRGDEIAHADQLSAGALATARIAPIYGKLNLAGEGAVHFQAFLLFGAGAASFRHESVNLCASAGPSACTGGFQSSTAVKPLGEAGAGMRFYLGRRWSLRGEVRAFLHPATYVRGADLTQPGTGTTATYVGLITTLGLGASALF